MIAKHDEPKDERQKQADQIVKHNEAAQAGKAGAAPKDAPPEFTPDQIAAHLMSANEPHGSNIGGEGTPPPVELPPLVLTSIDPVSVVVGSAVDFPLTVTGSGFDETCVILFDDEEFAPESASATVLSAIIPVAAAPAVVDVEVGRGEDLSEVLTFEFTAVAGRKSEPERKAKKAEPHGKRAKKGRR